MSYILFIVPKSASEVPFLKRNERWRKDDFFKQKVIENRKTQTQTQRDLPVNKESNKGTASAKFFAPLEPP